MFRGCAVIWMCVCKEGMGGEGGAYCSTISMLIQDTFDRKQLAARQTRRPHSTHARTQKSFTNTESASRCLNKEITIFDYRKHGLSGYFENLCAFASTHSNHSQRRLFVEYIDSEPKCKRSKKLRHTRICRFPQMFVCTAYQAYANKCSTPICSRSLHAFRFNKYSNYTNTHTHTNLYFVIKFDQLHSAVMKFNLWPSHTSYEHESKLSFSKYVHL